MEEKLNNILTKARGDFENASDEKTLESAWLAYFGTNGYFTKILKQLPRISKIDRPKIGRLANEIKAKLTQIYQQQKKVLQKQLLNKVFDVTAPSKKPPLGNLHLVTYAIREITDIFQRIGFNRVRYREVEWDWYSFSSLNFPADHPARDDMETFFVDAPLSPEYGPMLLSPHTSSGQVREMERANHKPPIRMINIAKCYRPNWDLTHTPMFHQFEGLVIDEGVNITNLKGTMDYFARRFFGPERQTRLRPFHFQFTEPSFEVDITCGICLGKGILAKGEPCRFCKEGWLELGGSGMVHPNVLKAGKIDPEKYSGFAFGWGVERTYMMKSGTQLDDNRLMYTNDIRFLEQF